MENIDVTKLTKYILNNPWSKKINQSIMNYFPVVAAESAFSKSVTDMLQTSHPRAFNQINVCNFSREFDTVKPKELEGLKFSYTSKLNDYLSIIHSFRPMRNNNMYRLIIQYGSGEMDSNEQVQIRCGFNMRLNNILYQAGHISVDETNNMRRGICEYASLNRGKRWKLEYLMGNNRSSHAVAIEIPSKEYHSHKFDYKFLNRQNKNLYLGGTVFYLDLPDGYQTYKINMALLARYTSPKRVITGTFGLHQFHLKIYKEKTPALTIGYELIRIPLCRLTIAGVLFHYRPKDSIYSFNGYINTDLDTDFVFTQHISPTISLNMKCGFTIRNKFQFGVSLICK